MLLPPGVAEVELDGGVDAGVAIAEGGRRDVDGVGAEIDGALGRDEVVEANAALRGEVPDAGVGVGAIVRKGEVAGAVGGVLVVGPEEAASSLHPRRELAGAGEVPTQNDGRHGDAGEGAANGEGGAAEVIAAENFCGPGLLGKEAVVFLELGRVGLPEGKEFGGVLEVAAKEAGAVIGGQNLAGVHTDHEELEVVAHVGDAFAALDDGADLNGERDGIGLGKALLRGGNKRREQEEDGEDANDDAAEGQAEAPGEKRAIPPMVDRLGRCGEEGDCGRMRNGYTDFAKRCCWRVSSATRSWRRARAV